jgi:hypothetical protein
VAKGIYTTTKQQMKASLKQKQRSKQILKAMAPHNATSAQRKEDTEPSETKNL